MMTHLCAVFVLPLFLLPTASAQLIVAENNLEPWPSGHGETPPPIGSVVHLDHAGSRQVVATGLQDPVWITASDDGKYGYVSLFHSGQIARVSLNDGSVSIVAKNLSCPEGVALHGDKGLYVVENPVGDECEAEFPLKEAAQLTHINIATGIQIKIAGLQSSTNGEEGGPHGLAIEGDFAYISDCPLNAASLVRVQLSTGTSDVVANLTSPSGCAIGQDFAYIVEQGDTDGQLVQVSLKDGSKRVLLSGLAGPMGVAVDAPAGIVYVGERHKNLVRSFNLHDGKSDVFASGLNSPIGLVVVNH